MVVLVDLVGVIVDNPGPLQQLGRVQEQLILVVGSLLHLLILPVWNLQ